MSDVINEEELHEAATEEPMGSEELRVKSEELMTTTTHNSKLSTLDSLKACNDRSYAKMNEIARIANECILRTTHAAYMPGQYGEDYRAFGRAFCEIRELVGRSLADVEPDYGMLAREMTRDGFDPDKLGKAIEAEASRKPIDYPTFYTPGWLCELAKRLSAGRGGRDGTGEIERRIAKTPQTIVFETISPSGLKLSAEWEAEETCHGAQAFLYKDDKCVCQIRFFNTFQTRNVGSHITRGALYALTSLCGHAKRWRENKKAGGAK